MGVRSRFSIVLYVLKLLQLAAPVFAPHYGMFACLYIACVAMNPDLPSSGNERLYHTS